MSIFNTVDIGAVILSFLSPTDLANIRLASHHLNSLATPLLYRHLDLDFSSVEVPRTLRFLTMLFVRPSFKVRTVTVAFGTKAHWQDSCELQYRFALVIGLVQRLQDLQSFTWNTQDTIPPSLLGALQAHPKIREVHVKQVFYDNCQALPPVPALTAMPALCGLELSMAPPLAERNQRDIAQAFRDLLRSDLRLRLKRLSVNLAVGGTIDDLLARHLGEYSEVLEFPALQELTLSGFGRRDTPATTACDPWNLHAARYPCLKKLAFYRYPFAFDMLNQLHNPQLESFIMYSSSRDMESNARSFAAFLDSFDTLREFELSGSASAMWGQLGLCANKPWDSGVFMRFFERHRRLRRLWCPGLFNLLESETVGEDCFTRIKSYCPGLREICLWVDVMTESQREQLRGMELWNLNIYPISMDRAQVIEKVNAFLCGRNHTNSVTIVGLAEEYQHEQASLETYAYYFEPVCVAYKNGLLGPQTVGVRTLPWLNRATQQNAAVPEDVEWVYPRLERRKLRLRQWIKEAGGDIEVPEGIEKWAFLEILVQRSLKKRFGELVDGFLSQAEARRAG